MHSKGMYYISRELSSLQRRMAKVFPVLYGMGTTLSHSAFAIKREYYFRHLKTERNWMCLENSMCICACTHENINRCVFVSVCVHIKLCVIVSSCDNK